MLIPGAAISLVWTLRAQGKDAAYIAEALRKPLTERPASLPVGGWFALWRNAPEGQR